MEKMVVGNGIRYEFNLYKKKLPYDSFSTIQKIIYCLIILIDLTADPVVSLTI